MAEFVNTIDTLGDEVVAKQLIERVITEFKDNVISALPVNALSSCQQLTTVDLPSVTTVGQEAFYGCTVLENVNLPNAQSIGYCAFYMCKNLAKLSLPKATIINIEAFYYCSALKELDIPSVTAVGGRILEDTNKSVEIVRLPATPPTIQTNSFDDINSDCVFYIPRGSLAAYQSAKNWSTLTGKYSFVEEDR